MSSKAPSAGQKDQASQTTQGTGTSESQQQPHGGAAPGYVAAQRHRDPAGPHGKNLTEGGFEGSGTDAGPWPEPGSRDDPGRAATQGGSGTAGGTGKKGGGVGQGSWYDKLGSDEPA